MLPLWANILYWAGWLALCAGVCAVILICDDRIGYRGKRRRPARIVTMTTSVAAVITGWQPRLNRVP